MTMHSPYGDDHGQDETADLVRSLALSSAKLWEELFDRLRRLEHAQAELREIVAKIEIALPAAHDAVAVGSGEGGTIGALPVASVATSFVDVLASVGTDLEGPKGDGEAASIEATALEVDAPSESAPETSSAISLERFHPMVERPADDLEPAPSLGSEALDIGTENVDDIPLAVEWHMHEPEVTEAWPGVPPRIWTSSSDDDELLEATHPSRAGLRAGFDTPETSAPFEAHVPPPPPPPVRFDLDDSPSLLGNGFDVDAPPPPPPGFTPAASADPQLEAQSTDASGDGDPLPPPPVFSVVAPPPPPGFHVGEPPPPPPGFHVGEPPPPPPGFHVGEPQRPSADFYVNASPPPPAAFHMDAPRPPADFYGAPPPPPDFSGAPPPPADFYVDASPPPPPAGFHVDAPTPPPPVAFTQVVPAPEPTATFPSTDPPAQHLGRGSTPPPPPPGYSIIRPRTAEPLGDVVPGDGGPLASGSPAGTGGPGGDDKGTGGEDTRAPAITPDFFARAGRRRS